MPLKNRKIWWANWSKEIKLIKLFDCSLSICVYLVNKNFAKKLLTIFVLSNGQYEDERWNYAHRNCFSWKVSHLLSIEELNTKLNNSHKIPMVGRNIFEQIPKHKRLMDYWWILSNSHLIYISLETPDVAYSAI